MYNDYFLISESLFNQQFANKVKKVISKTVRISIEWAIALMSGNINLRILRIFSLFGIHKGNIVSMQLTRQNSCNLKVEVPNIDLAILMIVKLNYQIIDGLYVAVDFETG